MPKQDRENETARLDQENFVLDAVAEGDLDPGFLGTGLLNVPRVSLDSQRTIEQQLLGQPMTVKAHDPKTQAIRDWWMQAAADEIDPMMEKIAEYGGQGRAQDLIDIGEQMHRAGVPLPSGETTKEFDAQYIELSIYFYIIGKIGRWSAAISEGRSVSDDTLLDIGIYVRMLQRVRAVGGWPN